MLESLASTNTERREVVAVMLLSLAPAIGLGLSRFAYALLLPDMKASLNWNFAQAGSMHAANAIGYLIGAITSAASINRLGGYRATFLGAVLCTVSVALPVISENFVLLSVMRLAAGVGAAWTFVGGGALTASISKRNSAKAGHLLGLFYAGPGIGIFVSAVSLPFLLERIGPGSWPYGWAALAVTAFVFMCLLPFAGHEMATMPTGGEWIDLGRIRPLLFGYSVFGGACTGYMTFMIAWMAQRGEGAGTQSAFWSLLGVGAILSPWVWRGVISRAKGGRAVSLLIAATTIGAMLPLILRDSAAALVSSFVFGAAVFSVAAAAMAFVRKNYPENAWPRGVATLTVGFGLGQVIGPLSIGFVADRFGNLEAGLVAAIAALLCGAAACLWQHDFGGRGAT